MGFNERLNLSHNFEKLIIPFLESKGFIVEKTGYENYVSDKTKQILRTEHNDITVRFLRYLPDLFVIKNNMYFFIELKVMDSPIRLDSRIESLKKITQIDDLSKENIGVIETSAHKNYQALKNIGIKVVLLVLSTFNKETFLADWEDEIVAFYEDNVKLGNGDASFTPYTNIHLDKMKSITTFLKENFGVDITNDELANLKKSILR